MNILLHFGGLFSYLYTFLSDTLDSCFVINQENSYN